jgi:hypothetical protein
VLETEEEEEEEEEEEDDDDDDDDDVGPVKRQELPAQRRGIASRKT